MENDKVQIQLDTKFPCEIAQDKTKTIHFIGLGGIGMSGLAKFLLELGYRVSGSDIKDGPNMFSSSAQGATVYIGHHAGNIARASLIVVSSAINNSNPEIIEAKKNNIPIIHRSQLLEAIMSGVGRDKKQISIGVSGTHGKTTTTGMIALAFEDAKLNPSIVVGGQMPFLNTNSKLGSGDHFIAELDESDGTIELYAPDLSVITNLEFDHPDFYKNGLDQVIETFKKYVSNLNKDSKIIINVDCSGNRKLLSQIKHEGIITYSSDETNEHFAQAKYKATNITNKGLNAFAKIYKNNEFIGDLKLGIPGSYNVSNALATIAAALEYGIDFEKIAKSLERFTGMKRRFQILGTVNGAKIIDDYAHHPTEIQSTLKAASDVVKSNNKGKVVAIFQPHRYSRLDNLWNDFLNSFNDADSIYVCDVYSAGEKAIENINSERLTRELKNRNVQYLPGSMEKVADIITKQLKQDDIVLTIGAGDITKLGQIIIEKAR